MTGIEKLRKDLQIIGRFAAEMAAYLDQDNLFWHTGPAIPELTVGGYLMRQQRLLLLRDLLDSAERLQLDAAVKQFQETLDERIVAFEQKAERELEARLRQWTEYLRDVQVEADAAHYYATAVEPRVMLAATIAQLELPPYRLLSSVPERLTAIDKGLRGRWREGTFVWPEEWQPAYPRGEYWYLYGRPTL